MGYIEYFLNDLNHLILHIKNEIKLCSQNLRPVPVWLSGDSFNIINSSELYLGNADDLHEQFLRFCYMQKCVGDFMQWCNIIV